MHEMIGQAMATDFERDRVTAASAARAAPAKARSSRTRFGQLMIRLAERLARRTGAPREA
jgi:hypothetical protein